MMMRAANAGITGSASPAGGHGSAAMMQAVSGLHMNPLLALLLVVGFLALLPWGLRRLRQRMPALLREEGTASRGLRLEDAIPLGSKRMLFSVAVRGADGQQATAVILTGGPADLCIGWLEGGRRPAGRAGGEAETRKARRCSRAC